ncbi:TPA_asm: hypothetical protein CBHJFHIM_00005 [Methanobrevibacter gottschalkii virus vir075]|uniref:Uncharacterized protein n=1 Tax=Methanobrevibacter gottschalkii TaxID=190974 RepID=A0A1H7I6N0_9EURY|nr:hypothetical protein [Methanobrevibacter gottschalkii]SEK57130.1 hypothetical protein SAMN05216439_1140 [Methanobrevibacter gottschalkii]
MKSRKLLTILLLSIIAVSAMCVVVAADATDELGDDAMNGIKVEKGKLLDYQSGDEIGTVKQINSTDEGEKEIYGYDSGAIDKIVSDDPLVVEYIVEDTTNSSNSGIYWMFGHDGKIFLAFNPTDKMGDGMLKRMTEFCKNQKYL